MGSFTAEVFLDRVPVTASNFIDLCRSEYYDGLHFHRVIPDFMNQFGCPYSKNPSDPRVGQGVPLTASSTFLNLQTGETQRRRAGHITDENISKDSNTPGSLSMANTGKPDSGGSQFFINVAKNDFLDWFTPGNSRHPVFAQVISGYEVVEAISRVKTKSENPVKPIKMNSIRIENLPAQSSSAGGSR
jgi:cyclophilin family peptidyl-prolyl cis-trans isomerase